MILELLSGVFVSLVAIIIVSKISILDTANKWIIVTSKFVYYSGHPILNDDDIYAEITKRFKAVFLSLSILIIKIVAIFLIILITIGLTAAIVALIQNESLANFNSDNFLAFYFPPYLVEFPFIIGSLLPLVFIPVFKRSKSEKETYSAIDKFLHYTFIGNKNIAKLLFKVELLLSRKKVKNLEPITSVYISGMARAGTTVLMQYLGQLDQFKSISYGNLPFLFLPVSWPKISSKKKVIEKERFHKDGIKHSLNSYEALEEPFWRNYIGDKFVYPETIKSHDFSKRIYEKYTIFRGLIADNKVYLAKNNNHLLRAKSIHQYDELHGNKVFTFIPFRNPYNQAKSLLNQHLLLVDLQKKDEFTLDYMDFLLHHEFGLNHKISIFKNSNLNELKKSDMNNVEYWLEIWYLFYESVYLEFSKMNNMYFFCYELFLKNPNYSLKQINGIIGIPEEITNSIEIKEFTPKASDQDYTLNQKYLTLYKNLMSISINNHG